MSRTKSKSDKYAEASKKFEEAYNKYSGDKGLQSANTFAKGEAETQAKMQSDLAGSRAGSQAQEQARTAGVSKAAAADMAASKAAESTRDTYGNVYNNTYGQGLNSALANNQAAVNARAQTLGVGQQEGQNEYNRAWGNIGGMGSMVTGLLTSDERLKHFQDVSSKISSSSKAKEEEEQPQQFDYNLLKVTYKKEKEENK